MMRKRRIPREKLQIATSARQQGTKYALTCSAPAYTSANGKLHDNAVNIDLKNSSGNQITAIETTWSDSDLKVPTSKAMATKAQALIDARLSSTNATDLTDSGATTLHKHDHGNMDGLSDDDHTQYMKKDGASNLDLNGYDIQAVGKFNFSSSAKTISGGAITVTSGFHTVDTEGAAASDDLTTINGGTTGQLLILRTVNNGRDVVVKHGAGNIVCGSDRSLLSTNYNIGFVYDGTNWSMLFYNAN